MAKKKRAKLRNLGGEKRGPKEEVLKIEGDWKDAVAFSFRKRRPKERLAEITMPPGSKRSRAARKAWVTMRSAKWRASKSERASKRALSEWCAKNGWRVIFFEGKTGAARTGIVDAVIARIRIGEADGIDVRLVQLKSGAGGLTGREIARIKEAVAHTSTGWLLAAFDGKTLHILPEMTGPKKVI